MAVLKWTYTGEKQASVSIEKEGTEKSQLVETERQLRIGRWEDEENHHTLVRTMTVRRSHTGTIKPAPSSAAGKRRRDVLKVIVPRTLDVNVYAPPKLSAEVPALRENTNYLDVLVFSCKLIKLREREPSAGSPNLRPSAPEEMMWGLLTRLCDLGAAGVCDAEQLLKALLERRHGALGLENEQALRLTVPSGFIRLIISLLRLFLLLVVKADDALPSSVVVHGRRGRNSNINGVYIRDYACEGPCFRRPDYAGGRAVFLYFEGEWRLGPSPEHGSVWAFAQSISSSPLLIDVHWKVWDGQQVVQDPDLRVSDLSLIPQVLDLSFADNSPPELKQAQGVLMQQPGLWDGRPYYKHTAFQELFLLCSAEGWRLGPLPLGVGLGVRAPVLLSRSPAAVPQEILEPWVFIGHMEKLPPGAVRLRPIDGAPTHMPVSHPRHIVIEGLSAGDGAANGVYRLAPEPLNNKPVYHKVDTFRTSSLWFTGGDWRFGPSIEDGRVWAYATADLLSSDANWRSFQGQVQEVQILDAKVAIPESIFISGHEFVQEKQFCDARPVYGATLSKASAAKGNDTSHSEGPVKVFLYFRAHQSEWWLGPVVGGTEFLARATGSLFQVIPRIEDLQWRVQIEEPQGRHEAEQDVEQSDLMQTPEDLSWPRLICSFTMAASGILLWSFRGFWSPGAAKKGQGALGAQEKKGDGPSFLVCETFLVLAPQSSPFLQSWKHHLRSKQQVP
ncbi:Quinolone resistance protein NorA [Durusdinium trenchii]|uniref:Quinolone resistance protein NorA n=1 Tax=Durusdinium trenchii TaxID=1381693 RepID=A0ABP0HNP9_9DINO